MKRISSTEHFLTEFQESKRSRIIYGNSKRNPLINDFFLDITKKSLLEYFLEIPEIHTGALPYVSSFSFKTLIALRLVSYKIFSLITPLLYNKAILSLWFTRDLFINPSNIHLQDSLKFAITSAKTIRVKMNVNEFLKLSNIPLRSINENTTTIFDLIPNEKLKITLLIEDSFQCTLLENFTENPSLLSDILYFNKIDSLDFSNLKSEYADTVQKILNMFSEETTQASQLTRLFLGKIYSYDILTLPQVFNELQVLTFNDIHSGAKVYLKDLPSLQFLSFKKIDNQTYIDPLHAPNLIKLHIEDISSKSKIFCCPHDKLKTITIGNIGFDVYLSLFSGLPNLEKCTIGSIESFLYFPASLPQLKKLSFRKFDTSPISPSLSKYHTPIAFRDVQSSEEKTLRKDFQALKSFGFGHYWNTMNIITASLKTIKDCCPKLEVLSIKQYGTEIFLVFEAK